MKNCRRIEPLLYLYRDNELSDDERKEVLEHTNTCHACRTIFQQLVSIDKILEDVRKSVPDLSADSALINDTMKMISAGRPRGSAWEPASLLDEVVLWLRPALRVALFAAVLIVGFQASRDASKIADLEQQLQEHGHVASESGMTPSAGIGLDDLAAFRGDKQNLFSKRMGTPAVAGDPLKLLAPGLMELVRHKTGLFQELARRYPHLSTITLEDGLDDRERAILATEGKEFVKEFERILQEGEK